MRLTHVIERTIVSGSPFIDCEPKGSATSADLDKKKISITNHLRS